MNTRTLWLSSMDRIARPVLSALAEDRLRETMPVRGKLPKEDRMQYTYLEAFGRTLTGIAPWLELDGAEGEERRLQAEYREMALKAMHNAVTPGCRDKMNFSVGQQPLVDAAFLAHAVLRAPKRLWRDLTEEDRRNLTERMLETRTRKPYACNWLLFSAMIECFLKLAGREWDRMRVDLALRMHFSWVKGDGFYGDGPDFHMDYYNSFVIHPMMVDILRCVHGEDPEWDRMLPLAEKYAARYASFLERLIMPDGSWPVLGRSSAYRYGCFHMLAQAALEELPGLVPAPAAVRCALTAAMRRIDAFGNTDGAGFLVIGVCGAQPEMGEPYISTGSLYLCLCLFLPLGLAPGHPFWKDPDTDWTMKRMWNGDPVLQAEHSLQD